MEGNRLVPAAARTGFEQSPLQQAVHIGKRQIPVQRQKVGNQQTAAGNTHDQIQIAGQLSEQTKNLLIEVRNAAIVHGIPFYKQSSSIRLSTLRASKCSSTRARAARQWLA